jgi:hypothetical protein
MSVGGWWLDPIGQRRLVGDGVTHDLRDSSKRVSLLGGPSAKPVTVARQFICEQARSRARARVIRKCMSMATSYRREELARPFVALRFRLNEADEDVKKALIARAVGATSEVFGERRELPAAPAVDTHEDIIEGHAAVEAEPDIPDEKQAPTKPDIRAVIARLAAVPYNPEKVGDPEGAVAYALRDALALKKYDKADLSLVRRKMVGTIFGVPVADMTAGQWQGLRAATKEPQGQQDLTALFAHLAELDDDVKRIRAAQP